MYDFITNLSKKEMDDFVSQNPLCNILQSANWASVKDNWQHLYTGVKKDGNLIATAMILIKKLPMNFTLFYIPRGPIMDYQDEEIVSFVLSEIKKIAKKQKCLYIILDPYVIKNQYQVENYHDSIFPNARKAIVNLKKAGAIHLGFIKTIEETIQPRFNANVYASSSFVDSLPKHTKKMIGIAEKKNIEIVHGGTEFIDDFSAMVEKTEARKQIGLRNKEYFTKLITLYGNDAFITLSILPIQSALNKAKESEQSALHEISALPENQVKKKRNLEEQLASYRKIINEYEQYLPESDQAGNIVIAGCLSIRYGNYTEMLYAGMDERFRSCMPQYKAYIEQMEYTFANGCEYFSMGGVEGTLDDGLTKFKSNFNPMIDEYIGEFNIPVHKLLYKLGRLAYNIRKRKKK